MSGETDVQLVSEELVDLAIYKGKPTAQPDALLSYVYIFPPLKCISCALLRVEGQCYGSDRIASRGEDGRNGTWWGAGQTGAEGARSCGCALWMSMDACSSLRHSAETAACGDPLLLQPCG